MARLELWVDEERPSPWTSFPELVQRLDTALLGSLRAGPLPDTSDAVAAEQLLELVWGELEAYGTDGKNACDDKQIAIAIRTLEAVTRRLGIPVELPFRNFTMGHPGFVGDLIRREDQVMARKSPYSAELRRRAVAMVADVRSEYDTEFAAITSVARQLGIGSAETLRKWVRQAEVDAGKRPGTSREEAAEIRVLKRRVAELERVNEILRAASSYFARELDFKL